MSCCNSSPSEKDFATVPAAGDKQNRDAAGNRNVIASVGSRCRCSCNTSRKDVMPATAQQAKSGAVRHSCQCLQCSCDEFCSCQASEIIALFDSIVAPQPQAISSSVHDGTCSGQERKPNVDDEEDHFTPTQSPTTISTSPSASASVTKIQAGIKSIQVSIMGMTCTMCKKTITNALQAVTGVVSVQINTSTDSGIIAYNSTILRGREGIQKILDTIEGAGYDVQLEVSHGMTDSNTSHVCDEEEAEQQQDVHTTDFSTMLDLTAPLLPHGECNEAAADRSRHQYRNRLEQREARQAKDLARRKHAFLTSLVGTVPIFLISMVLMHLPLPIIQSILRHPIIPGLTLDALLLWILCTPVQFGSGWVFYKNSYHNIRNRALGMDVLIALGITASYSYAVILIVLSIVTGNDSQGAEFFETSAVLISFVLLGKWLQLLAVRRTSDALTKLMNLAVKRATLVIPRSKIGRDQRGDELFCPEHDAFDEMEVDVEDLKRNDYVKILPGSGIPADGVIIYGDITVNESMITGESMPVYKESRDYVIGGSICEEGVAFVKLRNVGSETVLSKICRLIEDAQMNQAPIQEFADKVSSIFVPVVIGISLSTFLVWYILASFTELIPKSWMKGQSPATFAVMFALPTLVISCPCALGLATPTAVMVGTGVGATHGVLIKGGEKLEMVSRIEAVVFDKTGTLTKGKPIISDFIRVNTCSEHSKMLPDEDLLWLLGSLENNSNHPLANAVVSYAEKHGKSEKLQFATPFNLCAITGKGISGEIHQRSVGLGNRSFAAVKQIELSAEVERAMARLEHAARTAVFACVDDEVLAVIGISDEIREDSKATIHYLQQHFIDVWMVSGDNCRTSSAVAQALGISMEYVISEALPDTKLEKVKSLQYEGKVVAMVGDGINDSPALAQANIGISLSSGTEIATETADIILVKGDISDVCVAIDVARSIFNRIKINFLCALLYNCLCIPIAAGLFYPLVQINLPPVVAAAAMALSSVSVVISSLLLRCYKAPIIKKSHPQQSTIIHV